MPENERHVFLAPGSSEHINRSVFVPNVDPGSKLLSLQGLIPIDSVADTLTADELERLTTAYPDKRIRMWGTRTGLKEAWKIVMRGDLVVFYVENRYVCVAEIVDKTVNAKLAEKVWGKYQGTDTWEYVMFLGTVRPLDIPREEFNRRSGYKEAFVPQGFMRVANPGMQGRIIDMVAGTTQPAGFQFVKEDFDRCTGTKEDASYLSERFNKLLEELTSRLPSDLANFNNTRVARILGRGETAYRDFMWLGFAHSKLQGKTAQNVQFQVSIHKDSLRNFIWIDARAHGARGRAKANVSNNKQAFLANVNTLQGFSLGCASLGSDEDLVEFPTANVTEEDLEQFLQKMDGEDSHVHLTREFSPAQAVSRGTQVVADILTDWKNMLPIYNIMAFGSPTLVSRFSIGLYDEAFVNKVKNLLERQLQIILFGPPGTSKTHFALSLVEDLGAQHDIVQFHSSYSYEDFVEGITLRRDEGESAPAFKVVPKAFKEICNEAIKDPQRKYILIIDEINRALLGRVLGELILLLEYRDLEVRLPYSNEKLKLPKNLYVIGTMNSADRSIALVDYALRRRFAFVAMKPDVEILTKWLVAHSALTNEQRSAAIAFFMR